MTQDVASPVRPPILRLAAAFLGVGVLGAALAGWVATARGQSASMGLMTLAPSLSGIVASTLLLASRPARPAPAWVVPVLAAGIVRAMVGLLVALVMVGVLSLDKPVFLLTVLGVLLACLAIEVGVVVNMINPRGAATRPACLEGARS